MKRGFLIRWHTGLILTSIACFAAVSAFAKPDYAGGGANACIDCHDTPYVMGILKTAHAKISDSRTPAAQKECQSCHGPSARHSLFPMQVENLHFGKGSGAAPELQNALCLECHHDGDREAWRGSAHGFEKVVCSQCHSMHDPHKVVPSRATISEGCTTDACHGKLVADSKSADFTHALGRDLGGKGELTCAGCHNPHGPLDSNRCIDCHPRTKQVVAKESPKAQRFHEVAERKQTECIRCHKGIAHPIPPLVLQQSEAAMEALLAE